MMRHTGRSTKYHSEAPSSTVPLDVELYRIRHQEHAIHFVALQQPLERAVTILRQDVHNVTPLQCDEVDDVCHEVLRVIQASIIAFESPDMHFGMRPYPLLLRLWSFHRTLVEALVLVESVRMLCEMRRLSNDWTGAYWHLRQYVKDIIRSRQGILALFGVEVAHVSVGTDTAYRSSLCAATA